MSYNSIRLPQDLPVYYKNFFPVKPFIKWLRYGLGFGEYLNRREFAFILADDVHIRYRSCRKRTRFDIDLTDYDNVRNCCKEATVCPKCWKFMVLAVKILDFLLDDMFGFNARMWVFSGRRGVHCWVGDKKARMLTNNHRSAVATRLNLFKKNGQFEATEGKAKNTRVPPIVREAYNIAMKDGTFGEMVLEQGWLEMKISSRKGCY
ncbi:hypothetical protein B9Z55_010775 [Caenorhabditis nigoni]|uniref:Uncharacterized protein n=1 Tax=Caenorhabditis nigoni TaxID=1611254 RepID=A0A2G5UI87_9PELO|nr:hypothetical protein B9Z55_010775 [Caenorhabditis nigoni]